MVEAAGYAMAVGPKSSSAPPNQFATVDPFTGDVTRMIYLPAAFSSEIGLHCNIRWSRRQHPPSVDASGTHADIRRSETV